MLPSKTIPEHPNKGPKRRLRTTSKKSDKAKGKRRQRSRSPARESADAPPAAKRSRTTVKSVVNENDVSTSAPKTRNPIYLFYTRSDVDRFGYPGELGFRELSLHAKRSKSAKPGGEIFRLEKAKKKSFSKKELNLQPHMARHETPFHAILEPMRHIWQAVANLVRPKLFISLNFFFGGNPSHKNVLGITKINRPTRNSLPRTPYLAY
ncbi:hypothetical protein B0H13DRAFT_1863657 [Mycena leptocephala]|nr:hypothetical protein B0H13DRAFT_1863657 [Mycena leptocephala]